MLDRCENGREFEVDSASPSFVPTGIRNLGIEGNQGGMWVLPTFSPEIPLEIKRTDADTSSLAKFMLLAHEKGIAIPDSIYTTTTEAMTQQFASYAKSQVRNLTVALPMDVTLTVFDQKIELGGHATDRMQGVYQLKEPIERLNVASPGLGWFITGLIANGHSVGMTTYDPSRIASCVSHVWFYAETDLEMAAEAIGIDEEHVTAEQLEEVRNEHTFMPSDFLQCYGGHKNLLSWSQTEDEKAASCAMSVSEVRSCIHKLNLVDEDRALVMAALKFHDLIMGKEADDAVAPKGWFEHELDENQHNELESIGSLAFVVWDDSDFAYEAINHYEEYAMNGEGSTSQIVGLNVELDEPASWDRLIDAYKLYIERYAAFSTFIGLLPKE